MPPATRPAPAWGYGRSTPIHVPTNCGTRVTQWGVAGDRPVPGDYDSDHRTDLAVWRPANGTWRVLRSDNGEVIEQHWGLGGDIPVPADYDGDGRTDFAVWRPSSGFWHIIESHTRKENHQRFGLAGDIPIYGSGLPHRP